MCNVSRKVTRSKLKLLSLPHEERGWVVGIEQKNDEKVILPDEKPSKESKADIYSSKEKDEKKGKWRKIPETMTWKLKGFLINKFLSPPSDFNTHAALTR